MKERPTSCAREVRAAFGIILVVSPLSWTTVLEAVGQCPDPTTYPNGVIEGRAGCIGNLSSSSAVGMDDLDRFIVSFELPRVSSLAGPDIFVQRFASDGLTIGNAAPLSVTNGNQDIHFQPSIAMSRDSQVRVGWFGFQFSVIHMPDTVLVSDFDFDLLDINPVRPPDIGVGEWDPSVGVSSAASSVRSVTWTRNSPTVPPIGLLYGVTGQPIVQVRGCDPTAPCPTCGDICWINKWEPSLSQRSDGVFAIVWADAENPIDVDSPFNILFQLYDSIGNTIGGELLVNVPNNEVFPSTQQSPAIAFDDAGNIVVVWTGISLDGCTPQGRHVFARRLFWNGVGTPTFFSTPFQVDNDPTAPPISGADANPAVALTLDPGEPGRFIIAWNARMNTGQTDEIRAQFFEANGLPKGSQFRLNQDTSETGGGASRRQLANSGQHTLAYGVERVVATWTTFDNNSVPGEVHFTLLPPLFSDSLGEACCKADVNGDGLRDGLDIQPFVDLLLNPPPADPCQSIVEQFMLICPADMDSDGDVDVDDVPLFVTALLDTIPCAMGGFDPGASADCNTNGRPDATDVFFGTSQDCNLNGVPDECDISSQSSGDVNGNGVPDECEADCNSNGVPDDKDIAIGTSNDVNSNGVPDECDTDCNGNGVPDDWDLLQGTSADCNNNGLPDDCEEDCNGNGVPDDCDIDPTDPDGNGLVSADCNGNNWPDECDLAVPPPFGSLDCNNNGLPDECDIAGCLGDPACGDCNGNGVPDACDIASGISVDADANGIPDECEGQQAQGGGSGGAATLEAYTAFYDWCFTQDWGPHAGCTCSEQFQGMVDMEQTLGLPLGDPKYMPAPQE